MEVEEATTRTRLSSISVGEVTCAIECAGVERDALDESGAHQYPYLDHVLVV